MSVRPPPSLSRGLDCNTPLGRKSGVKHQPTSIAGLYDCKSVYALSPAFQIGIFLTIRPLSDMLSSRYGDAPQRWKTTRLCRRVRRNTTWRHYRRLVAVRPIPVDHPMRCLIVMLLWGLLAVSPSVAQDLREPVRRGDIERVKKLLASGADVNESYENQITPIFAANTPEMVKLLVAHGAKLELRSAASCQSPIECAAENYYRRKDERPKWKQIVQILRDAGAKYTIDTAIYMNDIEFIKKELASDDSWVNKTQGSGTVPLQLAARIGRVEICKLLLEHDADPDSFASGYGWPIICQAVDHPEVVKLLIQNHANLKRRITWWGGSSGIRIVGDEATALHYAVGAGNLESVKLLVEAGLDPSATDNQGQTPLHIAIRCERWWHIYGRDTSNYLAIVEYLLDNDASVYLKDRQGTTPLKLARKLKSPQAIRSALRKKQRELRDELP